MQLEKPTYRKWKFRSLSSIGVERLDAALATDGGAVFNEGYISRLSDRRRVYSALSAKVSFAGLLLYAALLMARYNSDIEMELFGFAAKNISRMKEVILVVASTLTVWAAVLSMQSKYLKSVIYAVLRSRYKSEVIQEFVALELFDDEIHMLSKQNAKAFGANLYTAPVVILAVMSLVSFLAVYSFSVVAMQVTAIIDVWVNPASPSIINVVSVVYSVVSLALYLSIVIFQLPLPQRDYTDSQVLTALKEANPEKYDEVMVVLARESKKRRDILVEVSSAILFSMVLLGLVAFSHGYDVLFTAQFASMFVVGGIGNQFFVPPVVRSFIAITNRAFFKYVGESHYNIFIAMKWLWCLVAAMAPVVVATRLYAYAREVLPAPVNQSLGFWFV